MEFIRRVYGGTYPPDLFPDVNEIRALIQSYPVDSLGPGARLAAESPRMLDFVCADTRGRS
jgi:hypothetical protein